MLHFLLNFIHKNKLRINSIQTGILFSILNQMIDSI